MVEFLRGEEAVGDVSPGTLQLYARAAERVMAAVGPPGWDDLDVRTVDVHALGEKFVAAAQGRFNESTLRSYVRRFARGQRIYLEHLGEPVRRGRARTAHQSPRRKGLSLSPDGPWDPRGAGSQDEMIDYPLPLPSGALAKLLLPRRLLPEDADRLRSFVAMLVVNDADRPTGDR
jgi:hypothetical protein